MVGARTEAPGRFGKAAPSAKAPGRVGSLGKGAPLSRDAGPAQSWLSGRIERESKKFIEIRSLGWMVVRCARAFGNGFGTRLSESCE